MLPPRSETDPLPGRIPNDVNSREVGVRLEDASKGGCGEGAGSGSIFFLLCCSSVSDGMLEAWAGQCLVSNILFLVQPANGV
jgi:hypothetical protein